VGASTLRKRFLPITIITTILAVTAVAGYLLPQPTHALPPRLLLVNKGGNVIFTHQQHSKDFQLKCGQCHHYTASAETAPPKCESCHPTIFDKQYVDMHKEQFSNEAYCNACHHNSEASNFDHDAHLEYTDKDCQACHHDADIEAKPSNCADCHEHKSEADMPTLRDAAHKRCKDCHEDIFEEGLKGCSQCHVRDRKPLSPPEFEKPCSDCHEHPVNDLIPNTTNAFHGQCRGCHRTTGKGPYGDDFCYHCHIK